MANTRRLTSAAAILGLAAIGITAMPHDAQAWWRRGFGVVWSPPIIVAPPVYAPRVYAPPTAYYAPPVVYAPPPAAYYPAPRRSWVPPHWAGPYWVRGHWG